MCASIFLLCYGNVKLIFLNDIHIIVNYLNYLIIMYLKVCNRSLKVSDLSFQLPSKEFCFSL
jgi:hypothetical protein